MKSKILWATVCSILVILTVGGPALAAQGDVPPGPVMTSLAGTVTVVSSEEAPAGNFGVERVLCPSGMVALGGGIDMDNVLTMLVTSSAPTFAGSGARLILQPDGTLPAPIGWQASAYNNAATAQEFKVAVICAPLSDVSTVVGSDDAPADSFGVERVLCPSGKVAVGGGIDMNNVLNMFATSSAPTFAGSDARLISQPDGTLPAPIGWQGSAYNIAGSTQDFKVAVICAPVNNVQTVVGSDTVQGGSFAPERVTCPAGMNAVGGGIDMDNVLTMIATSSGPTFAGTDARLISRPDGEHSAPLGWQVSAYNDLLSPQSFKVAAICLNLDKPYVVYLPLAVRE